MRWPFFKNHILIYLINFILDNSIIFGGIFPTDLYNPPIGYCWDWGCGQEPVIDNIESEDYNLDELVSTYHDFIRKVVSEWFKIHKNYGYNFGSSHRFNNSKLLFQISFFLIGFFKWNMTILYILKNKKVLFQVSSFIRIVKLYAKFYPTNNILIPMGGDFHYEAAEMNYINMDRFIK